MAALKFPVKSVRSDLLRHELGVSLGIPDPYVDVYKDRLEVVGKVDESMRSAIERVLASHDPTRTPAVDTESRLSALEARLDRAETAQVAGDAAKLRDALRGGG